MDPSNSVSDARPGLVSSLLMGQLLLGPAKATIGVDDELFSSGLAAPGASLGVVPRFSLTLGRI